MKLVINLMISVSAGMIAEALALGRKGGLDWQQMLEVMETSAVASPMVKYKTPVLKDRDFTSTMSAIAQTKDIDLILDAAKIHGVPLHLTVTLRQMYQALIAQGDGEDDYIAIVKQVERSAGLNVDGVIK
jgi:3-hydroxyisobutyrate dehydrogenase-like beta-hydroxyacid dehydrogenase